jgi:hypothetical protein
MTISLKYASVPFANQPLAATEHFVACWTIDKDADAQQLVWQQRREDLFSPRLEEMVVVADVLFAASFTWYGVAPILGRACPNRHTLRSVYAFSQRFTEKKVLYLQNVMNLRATPGGTLIASCVRAMLDAIHLLPDSG